MEEATSLPIPATRHAPSTAPDIQRAKAAVTVKKQCSEEAGEVGLPPRYLGPQLQPIHGKTKRMDC